MVKPEQPELPNPESSEEEDNTDITLMITKPS